MRDLVFECPCSARWTPDGGGRLTLTHSVRSFRSAHSGEVVLAPFDFDGGFFRGQHPEEADIGRKYPTVGRIGPGSPVSARQSTISLDRPAPGATIGIALWERAGEPPEGVRRGFTGDANGLRFHEVLAMWPVPGGHADRIDFVDILTDTDGDGVGDANERAAGTAPDDPGSVPGRTTIDLLAVYNEGIREFYGGSPETRIHHVITVVNSVFADSGTNLRLRTVGISEIGHDERGYGPSAEERAALMDRHGADVYLQWHARPRHGVPDANCHAFFGGCSTPPDAFGYRMRGHWSGDFGNGVGNWGALTVVHELGHALGLAHSARQGEAWGAFRWSRGHYIGAPGGASPGGTIMSYGISHPVFSDPDADCGTGPCGLPVDHADGADAVASLDLLRFQIAANRDAKRDADGDGFVDPVDAFPRDAAEWRDADDDGLGDIADRDDDGDGVADAEDAFPLDPGAWADADDDGVADRADAEVGDLAPFRDAALRAAVEEALGKTPGAPISADDMATLESLRAYSRGIRDLTGLEQATNLVELVIVQNHVNDLAPLSGLTALTHLNLNGNNLVEVSPLSGLTRLEFLSLSDTNVVDLSPLTDLVALRTVILYQAVALVDISPLARLPELRRLGLTGSWNVDFSQLAEFTGLSRLDLGNNRITDLSPLGGLDGLTSLLLGGNEISDLSPLAGLEKLETLGLRANPLDDISVLTGMPELEVVDIRMTGVEDLTPLTDLDLRTLDVGWTPLSLDDVLALPNARGLVRLGAPGLGVRDVSGLRGFDALEELDLDENGVSDIAPLAGLPLPRIRLAQNDVADIAPLVVAERWAAACRAHCSIDLRGNPLDTAALGEHIPRLEAWGVNVRYTEDQVHIADPVLRRLFRQQLAIGGRLIDDPVAEDDVGPGLQRTIYGFNAGVSDLAGLEPVAGRVYLFLGSNAIADVSPLAGQEGLAALDLSRNLVSDLGPLVANPSTQRQWMTLTGNPLTEESLNVHVPALRDAGWRVRVDSVSWIVVAGGAEETFDTADYFASLLGSGLRFEVEADGRDLASVEMVGGALAVSPGGTPGTLTVTVTATDARGEEASLDFEVALALPHAVPLFASADDAVRQGFVRVVNRSTRAGAVRIDTFDDNGRQAGQLILALRAGAVAHFNSADLEDGNRGKRLTGLAGAGEGDWRLRLASGLDLEVLSYVRTADGFLTSMHDLVPEMDGVHRVAIFNPGSNTDQVSRLRIVNPAPVDAEVTVAGVDGDGASPGGSVELTVPAHATRTFSAAELESGSGLHGALGDGAAKWSLTVSSDAAIRVLSLLESPGGHLTNLSTVPAPDGAPDGHTHAVPLFPSASDGLGRQGFVRVINDGNAVAEVGIAAFDETQRTYEPLTLTVGAGRAAHFNSDDLELGNPGKGLAGRTGAGIGDWRLELTGGADLRVLSYIRTRDGFLTSMHDVVPRVGSRHRVPIFNPGRNTNQVSQLRLINAGEVAARVEIGGVDDTGSPGDKVETSIPAGGVRTFTAAELESGTAHLEGSLGEGVGKWRLVVESDRKITVMSLLASPTGHLTNLSSVPDNKVSRGG